jgi:beta-lactamase superfamily II metal-dependent hydrolase
MHTGDASLKDEKHLSEFLEHYDVESPLVSVFVLPHHGSRRSFDSRLQKLRELAASIAAHPLFLAPAEPDGRYRHPDGDVVHACSTLGQLLIVDTQGQSRYSESAASARLWCPYCYY